jgi:hypothetical protein
MPHCKTKYSLNCSFAREQQLMGFFVLRILITPPYNSMNSCLLSAPCVAFCTFSFFVAAAQYLRQAFFLGLCVLQSKSWLLGGESKISWTELLMSSTNARMRMMEINELIRIMSRLRIAIWFVWLGDTLNDWFEWQ